MVQFRLQNNKRKVSDQKEKRARLGGVGGATKAVVGLIRRKMERLLEKGSENKKFGGTNQKRTGENGIQSCQGIKKKIIGEGTLGKKGGGGWQKSALHKNTNLIVKLMTLIGG